MSPDLQNALDSLFLARVPGQWERVSQLIMPNIGLWWVSILSRNEQLYNWMKSNRPNCFWSASAPRETETPFARAARGVAPRAALPARAHACARRSCPRAG